MKLMRSIGIGLILFLGNTSFSEIVTLLHAKIVESDSQPTRDDQPANFKPYKPEAHLNYFSYQSPFDSDKACYVLMGYKKEDRLDVKKSLERLLERAEQFYEQ